MTTQLAPFAFVSHCPKCGEKGGGTDFVPDGTHVVLKAPPLFPVQYHGAYAQCLSEVEEEHLHRTCPRCGFGWAEACIEGETA